MSQGCIPLGVAGVRPQGGPFFEQGAVEALDFAVGPGAVVPDAFAGDGGRGVGLGEQLGLVAGAVVGQHPLGGDAMAGEERLGPLPVADRCALALVGQDLPPSTTTPPCLITAGQRGDWLCQFLSAAAFVCGFGRQLVITEVRNVREGVSVGAARRPEGGGSSRQAAAEISLPWPTPRHELGCRRGGRSPCRSR